MSSLFFWEFGISFGFGKRVCGDDAEKERAPPARARFVFEEKILCTINTFWLYKNFEESEKAKRGACCAVSCKKRDAPSQRNETNSKACISSLCMSSFLFSQSLSSHSYAWCASRWFCYSVHNVLPHPKTTARRSLLSRDPSRSSCVARRSVRVCISSLCSLIPSPKGGSSSPRFVAISPSLPLPWGGGSLLPPPPFPYP